MQLNFFGKHKKRVHIAIMKKSWGLTQKILAGEKTIETRWYMNRYRPWNRIKKGDIVYFKDSGEPVTVRAKVAKVEQYANLDEKKRKRILSRYSYQDLGITEIIPEVLRYTKGKRYCIVIHLKNPKPVKPFEIDKSDFGLMSAWLIADDLEKVKISKEASNR